MARALVKVQNVEKKNYLINGNFDFWQRGTTFTNGQKYTADRFWQDTAGTTTTSRQTSGAPLNSSYVARALISTGPGVVILYQALENSMVKALIGKTITFSALVRRNSTLNTGNIIIAIEKSATPDAVNTGFSSIGSVSYPLSNITTGTSSTDWTLIQVTAVVPTDGTANGLRVTVGSDNNNATGAQWETAQWMLNEGPAALPFRLCGNSVQQELAICQRYCIVYGNNTSVGDSRFGLGQAISTTAARIQVYFPVVMRGIPTITGSSAAANFSLTRGDGTGITIGGYSTNAMTIESAELSVTGASGLTVGQATTLFRNDSASIIMYSAEL